ncbi:MULTISPECIES: DUF1003 domain-containing protein [Bosea]|uniref:DUF1003 domain-containing protein n=1 Tax=Bosea TaxID=85413 RepID=UPI00214FCC7D|nr:MULTISPECIES: DUF1003 domain-containing protein [Bosea]MCR4523575.1 DUF1003 domain-containing protein [Bosea sp. 47.2.35]MDR6827018.1 putative membrane protein [Bosea robiniae]MDR6893728.1 putative membrane protein [Bosea sp. BE109]MDR7136572.1 putative membrane protein [Bosea sp. BE168]MDR7173271.1 putative membrane protein [Bosea sp. BE271]
MTQERDDGEVAEAPSAALATLADPASVAGAASKKRGICAISGQELARKNLIEIGTLRPALADHIRNDFPDLPDHALISLKELARYRTRYVEEILREEHGEYSDLDREVAESIARQETIAENTEDDFEEHRTLGERFSDNLASFGGSWAFLISFGFVLAVWMGINGLMGEAKAFDPYPFILLNLVLSCIAAVQAPIIMMSQKRQESKDRLRSLNDYQVNLKAELEIRHLHEKMDHLVTRQWQRLAEIQQVQLEMLQEAQLPKARAKRRKKPVAKKKRAKPAEAAAVPAPGKPEGEA